MERRLIFDTLERTRNNRTQAAKLLGTRASALVAEQLKRPPVIDEREAAKRRGVFRSALLRI